MAYVKTNWVNNSTPINATNLNKIENELEFLDTSTTYSTTETAIGTWIDGKTIYRKVFSQSDDSNINNAVLNSETIIRMECLVKRNGANVWRNVPWLFVNNGNYGAATWAGGFYFNNGSITFQLGSDLGYIDKLILIIEYTKATS